VQDKKARRVLPNLLNPAAEDQPKSLIMQWVEAVTEDDIKRITKQQAAFDAYDQELEDIKKNRPLGSVVAREPKSLEYSEVPKPAWKRKLRP